MNTQKRFVDPANCHILHIRLQDLPLMVVWTVLDLPDFGIIRNLDPTSLLAFSAREYTETFC